MAKDNKKLVELGRYLLNLRSKKKIREIFLQAGYEELPYQQVALAFLGTILVTLCWYGTMMALPIYESYGIWFLLATLVLFSAIFEVILVAVMVILTRIYLEFKTYNRTETIESNLPMFLRQFSTNLKAGSEDALF